MNKDTTIRSSDRGQSELSLATKKKKALAGKRYSARGAKVSHPELEATILQDSIHLLRVDLDTARLFLSTISMKNVALVLHACRSS